MLALALVGVGVIAPSVAASTRRARADRDPALGSTETLLTYLPSQRSFHLRSP